MRECHCGRIHRNRVVERDRRRRVDVELSCCRFGDEIVSVEEHQPFVVVRDIEWFFDGYRKTECHLGCAFDVPRERPGAVAAVGAGGGSAESSRNRDDLVHDADLYLGRLPSTTLDGGALMAEPTAKLIWDGKEIELPVVRGSEDECAIDISKLRAQTGLITLDYGYMNTGSTESAITFIDGELGILRYRGYDIEDLAEQEHPSFLETAWLLIYGELPTQAERDEFSHQIRLHTLLHEDVKRFYDGFPKDAHPMATLASVVNALAAFYQHKENPHDPDFMRLSIIRLLAKLPTIAAYSYKKSIGQPFLYPDNSLDLIENFLRMMFAVPSQTYEVSDTVVHALKQLLILHADHEQNCSTSTVRIVGSADANIYASMAAGIDALWGPLHGGANQDAIEMLEGIRDSGGDVNDAVRRAKDAHDDFRLSGFGHRVYKNYDPRAKILKGTADRVLKDLDSRDALFDIALELEDVALTDDYFIERKLYPNVDFYSGLIYRAMGFPTNMFTVLFAIGRLPGWIAHWKEGYENDKTKIGRPRQVYTGPTERKYVPIDQRT
jgi:citrate synthase